MAVVVNKKNKIVVIEFDSASNDMNTSDFVKVISEATGVDAEKLVINVETNKRGEIVRVLLYIDNDKDANIIVDMINDLDKGNNCQAGIICRSKHAYISIEYVEIEIAYSESMEKIAIMCLMMLLFIAFFN